MQRKKEETPQARTGRGLNSEDDRRQLVSNQTCEATQASDLLEISPYQADGGELIGKAPAEVPSEILSRYYRETNPLKAIRARCLDCCCGNASEVRKCVAVDCPSWPFRMGVNPFRQKPRYRQSRSGQWLND